MSETGNHDASLVRLTPEIKRRTLGISRHMHVFRPRHPPHFWGFTNLRPCVIVDRLPPRDGITMGFYARAGYQADAGLCNLVGGILNDIRW
jgi:hypothetical protein